MLIGKQISGLLLLFSSKRVCCHCGVRHNAEMDLCGTDFVCANRLHSNDTSKLKEKLCHISHKSYFEMCHNRKYSLLTFSFQPGIAFAFIVCYYISIEP